MRDVLLTVDATGAVSAEVGLRHGRAGPDAGDFALPPGLLPGEKAVHSLRPGLCRGRHCRLRQRDWPYHHLRVGTVLFLCQYVFLFGMICDSLLLSLLVNDQGNDSTFHSFLFLFFLFFCLTSPSPFSPPLLFGFLVNNFKSPS